MVQNSAGFGNVSDLKAEKAETLCRKASESKRKCAQGGATSKILLLIFLLTALSFAVAGCAKEEQEAVSAPQNEGRGDETELILVDKRSYHELIDGHRGKVVLVDFWATWCPPCVASFPGLVNLNAEYSSREDVEIIAASVDRTDNADAVRKFLSDREADFKNLLVDTDDISDFISSVSDSWHGTIPAVFIYGRSGEIIAEYFGSSAVEEAEKALKVKLNNN